MGEWALIPLKTGRLRPKSAKDAEERVAALPRVLDKVGSGLFPRRKLGARFRLILLICVACYPNHSLSRYNGAVWWQQSPRDVLGLQAIARFVLSITLARIFILGIVVLILPIRDPNSLFLGNSRSEDFEATCQTGLSRISTSRRWFPNAQLDDMGKVRLKKL
jgi:hypothetical protein